jgi:hypothetical protein
MGEADNYEPYGSSYTSYEDNFSDRFPGYYGPSTTTAYDPSLYNMGGQSNSMMMGQGQGQIQGQFQGQGQGQFQMNQNQGRAPSGWPGM